MVEKIAISLNIEDLSTQLLSEICEAMYLKNSLLYLLDQEKKHFFLAGRRGYKSTEWVKDRAFLEIFTRDDLSNLTVSQKQIDYNSVLSNWLTEHREILEKEQVEIDPQYQSVKEELLRCFKELDMEVIIPVVFKEKIYALLGLGKKENLQSFTLNDIKLLKKLGQEVGVTVFNVLHYEDVTEKERLEEELKMGRKIQMSLLPQNPPQVASLAIQGFTNPAREIGGDYYDFITLTDKEKTGIVIGDVSGKGVGAGLLMAMVKMAIHIFSSMQISPKQILLKINEILNSYIGGEKFMSMLYLVWDAPSSRIVYSSAGHEHILVYRGATENVDLIESGGMILGVMPGIEPYLEEKNIFLSPGDKILLYTDGVTEAHNENKDRFGLSRLSDVFKECGRKSAVEIIESIKNDINRFMGNFPQYDDMTLVVLGAS